MPHSASCESEDGGRNARRLLVVRCERVRRDRRRARIQAAAEAAAVELDSDGAATAFRKQE